MSRAKSHLYVTPLPIRSGDTLEVSCGDTIPHALPVYVGEDAATVAVTCSGCRKAAVGPSERFTWHYAIVNGQEMKLEGKRIMATHLEYMAELAVETVLGTPPALTDENVDALVERHELVDRVKHALFDYTQAHRIYLAEMPDNMLTWGTLLFLA